jgi:hypothetical protein
MKFKFNSGYGAILCENCAVIIASGHMIPDNISKDKNYFCCEECRQEYLQKHQDAKTEVLNLK